MDVGKEFFLIRDQRKKLKEFPFFLFVLCHLWEEGMKANIRFFGYWYEMGDRRNSSMCGDWTISFLSGFL